MEVERSHEAARPQEGAFTGRGPRDEITEYHSARWLGASEACWRLFGFSTHAIKPAVYRLQLHDLDQQRVTFDPGQLPQELLDAGEKMRRTPLTEYFELNRAAKEALDDGRPVPYATNPLDHYYLSIPEYFTWDRANKKWRTRKQRDVIGRMYFLGPKAGDRFYLRQLLCHVKGAVSFEDLRTVHGHTYSTYKEACIMLGLAFNDREYDEALAEAAQSSTGTVIRSLFVVILLECNPVDPLRLWETHKNG